MATAAAGLRVASWNLRSGLSVDRRSLWWARRRRVARVLAEVDADVWAFQEVFGFQRSWVVRHGLPGGPWGHAGDGRDRRRRGEAVPVTWHEPGLRLVGTRTCWLGPTPRRPGSVAPGAGSARIATAVDLELADGRAVRLVNTHLDAHSADARRTGAAQIVTWAEEGADGLPLVVAGDMNATLDDPELAPLLEAGLVPVLPSSAGPTATAFETEPGRRLDHLLVSDAWEVVAAEVVTGAGTASDHYPVVADLRLRES